MAPSALPSGTAASRPGRGVAKLLLFGWMEAIGWFDEIGRGWSPGGRRESTMILVAIPIPEPRDGDRRTQDPVQVNIK